MLSAKAAWENTLDTLKNEMTPTSYTAWITALEPICVDEDVLILVTPNEVTRNTLNNIYRQTIAHAVNKVNGTSLEVSFIGASERARYVKAPLPTAYDDNGTKLDPSFTFDSFVIGRSNEYAHAAAKAVADAPPHKVFNPLFIYGGVGLGKTHLMHAIGHAIRKNFPLYRILYVTSETFTNEVIQAIGENSMSMFRRKYRSVDLLMVDDIQFIAGKVRAQEEFFNTFNDLYSSGKQIVLNSDRPPKELNTLEERLKSRFEGGLPIDVQPPDLETRAAILRSKCQGSDVYISDRVLMFIAENVHSNIRQLQGALTRVMAYAQFNNTKTVDMNLAETALRDIISLEDTSVTIELIQQVVSDYYNIGVDKLSAAQRSREVSYPRQVAMYLCRQLINDTSLATIGAAFGGKHHTTVINAIERIGEDIKSNRQTAATIEDLTKRIQK